jgi:alkanesulfonate monooxygenase SsuD/methylene tetrahydromethanopterin reductase-like flavin-dependent oxidoreductase (luciferase family)
MIRLAWGSAIGPDAVPALQGRSWLRPEIYAETLQMVEKAGIEFAILSESSRLAFNPMILVGALSTYTSTLGLVPELRTTDYPPFKLARLIGTLTHVTGGRIGWAMDTGVTDPGQYNYDMDQAPDPALRHPIADEYVEVCDKLWHSWAPDALLENAETGIFADPAKVQPIRHAGTYFRVRGPLNILTAPYGAPLLVQYVGDAAEYAFAGRHADVAILSSSDPAALPAARSAIEAAAIGNGRLATDVLVYISVSFQLGETDAARDGWRVPARPGVVIRTTIDDAVGQLQQIFHDSGCAGVVIQSDWSTHQTNIVCNQLVARLRREARLAPRRVQIGLRQRVLDQRVAT